MLINKTPGCAGGLPHSNKNPSKHLPVLYLCDKLYLVSFLTAFVSLTLLDRCLIPTFQNSGAGNRNILAELLHIHGIAINAVNLCNIIGRLE